MKKVLFAVALVMGLGSSVAAGLLLVEGLFSAVGSFPVEE